MAALAAAPNPAEAVCAELALAGFPETAEHDSSWFFEQERVVKIELLDLSLRQRHLTWKAQLLAKRAKQLWTEENLAELGLPPGHSLGRLDSQDEVHSSPATPTDVPAPSGGAKRGKAANSEPPAAKQKKSGDATSRDHVHRVLEPGQEETSGGGTRSDVRQIQVLEGG